MDDFTVSVRQIGQYPQVVPGLTDLVLLQQSGLGGAYACAQVTDLIAVALNSYNPLTIKGTLMATGVGLPLTGVIGWGIDPMTNLLYGGVVGGLLAFSPSSGWRFDYASPAGKAQSLFNVLASGSIEVPFGTLSVARGPAYDNEVTTRLWTELNTVASFNGRIGPVCLQSGDMNAALCLGNGDAIASQWWVNETIRNSWQTWYATTPLVYSFQGRVGDICLTDADVTMACTAIGAMARTNTPPPGDISTRIANAAFVADAIDDVYNQIQSDITNAITGEYAPINSPAFTGIPTAPTANPGSSTGQLATTAFVAAAIVASTTGVSSFNTRTGAIILEAADITNATGALINSPAFTGIPTAPTAIAGNATTQLATTAFVTSALAAFVPTGGVTSFNTRTGAVILSTADITGAGGAPLNNAGLTGIPTAPTAAPATATTQLATTAFVTAALAAATGVASFNGRTGVVTLQANDVSAAGGALIASPVFTGNPSAPTQNPGTSNTTLATTAFVTQAISGVNLGVTSFNTRTGVVTLVAGDITTAGGALLASPALTGVPTAPTPVTTSSDTTIATTAFVKAAISGSALVSSFNGRTGVVTLQGSDVSAAGGALVASPAFTGTPTAPTAVAGTNTMQIASTAFVMAAILAGGGAYLPLTGGTLTGALAFNPATTAASGGIILGAYQANPTLTLNAPMSFANVIQANKAGTSRWQMVLGDSTSESGSNAGSNFVITRYNDSGQIVDNPLTITRSNGQVVINDGLIITPTTGTTLQVNASINCSYCNAQQYVTIQQTQSYLGSLGVYTPGVGGGVWCGFSVDSGGVLYVIPNGGSPWSYAPANSDERIKYDIAPSTLDCLNEVAKIPTFQFRLRNMLKSDPHRLAPTPKPTRNLGDLIPVGFVAQRLDKVAPWLVMTGNDTWGVNTMSVVALLVGAVQQLAARVAELESPPIRKRTA